MFDSIQVTYKSTNRVLEANQFLSEIRQYDTIGCDLEVASIYTEEQLEECKTVLNEDGWSKEDKIRAQSILNSDALGHPSHCTVTHGIIGVSETESYVFILDNERITNLFMNFLVNTKIKQIWHNASYDFKHILYHTSKFPKNYEDTQILAKTLLNHVNTFKAKTGLKELAGHWYGDWAISVDNFTVEQMYEPKVLKYAAIDGCAVLKLWWFINEQCDQLDEEIKEEFYETYGVH